MAGASHKGDGHGDYPHECAYGERCLHGGKVRTSPRYKEAVQYMTNPRTGTKWVWHADCRRAFGPPPGVIAEFGR